MLQIYNTLTRKKEAFTPINPGKVGLYVCGCTVYDLCHIGHARTYISFDNIARYMRFSGLEVNYVRNITDVEDKSSTVRQKIMKRQMNSLNALLLICMKILML